MWDPGPSSRVEMSHPSKRRPSFLVRYRAAELGGFVILSAPSSGSFIADLKPRIPSPILQESFEHIVLLILNVMKHRSLKN
jgi:hypothetical protein